MLRFGLIVLAFVVALLGVGVGLQGAAHAQPGAAPRGLVVVSTPAGTDIAWPLAHDVYASPGLRPLSLDEAHARVLAGEAAPDAAAQELRDLADTRAAIHGDDAPSRQLLVAIAQKFQTRGVIVVDPGSAPPKTATARVFLVDSGNFDAARYSPDDGAFVSWHGAVQSLTREYGVVVVSAPSSSSSPGAASGSVSGAATVAVVAPSTAPVQVGPAAPAQPTSTTVPGPVDALRAGPKVDNIPSGPKHFYESPWFWGAMGAAALLGAGAYFLSRDNGSDTVHLQLQVPR